jgi:hypothetical protein
VEYRRTGRDLELSDPCVFEQQFAEDLKKAGRNLNEAAITRIREDIRRSPLTDQLFKGSRENLLNDYVPFHAREIVTAERVSADHPVRLFPSILDLTLDVGRPQEAVAGLPNLWTSALLGRWNQPSVDRLRASGSNVLDYPFKPLTVRAALGASSFGFPERYGEIPNSLPTPFQASRIGTAYVKEDPWSPQPDEFWVITGSDVDDFCLYFLLSRLTGRACWCPLGVGSAEAEMLLRSVCHAVESWAESPRVNLLHGDGGDLGHLLSLTDNLRCRFATRSIEDLLDRDLPRRYLIHDDPARTQGLIQFVEHRSSSFLPSPQPTAVKGFMGPKHWLVDCVVEGFHLPRRPGLAEKVLQTTRS